MATATATASTRSSGVQPYSTITFTGGSDSDRITAADIAAAHTSLDFDAETGRLTQSDTTPRTYYLGGDSDSDAADCFVHLANVTVQLEDNPGTDSSSLDLGNDTSKFILGNQCDAVIGIDTGDPEGAFNGNVTIRGANWSYNFFSYTGIFEEHAKIVCHGYLVFAGRDNTRLLLVNRNSESQIRLVIAGHTADAFAELVGPNVDLDVASAELVVFTNRVSFRQTLVPGSLVSDELSIPAATIAGSDTKLTLYWNTLADLDDSYTISDLVLFQVGESDPPPLEISYVNASDGATILLRRYHNPRDDANFLVLNNNGHLTIEVAQDVTFGIVDPAGAAVTAYLRVESGSYGGAFNVVDAGAPTLTTTDYGTVVNHTATTGETVEIKDKVIAANKYGAQTSHGLDDTAVASADLTPVRWSAWAYGRMVLHNQALTLADVGESSVSVQMATDPNVTTADPDDVPALAGDSDDVYDMIHKHVVDNQLEFPGSVTSGRLDVGSRDVTFSRTMAMAVSDDEISVPCGTTVTKGDTITGIVTTGTVTIASGIDMTAGVTDSSGKRINIRGLPAGHDSVVGAWPRSDSDRGNIVTGAVADGDATNIVLTLDTGTEYDLVADAVSYLRSAVVQFDTAVHDDVDVSLRRIVDPAGNDLIPAADDLDTDQTTRLGLITYDVANDEVTFGATSAQSEYSYDEVARAIEVGQSSEAALADPYVFLIAVGSFALESGSDRTVKRASGVAAALVPDLNAFQVTKIGSDDPKDFVDYEAGAIIVNTGVPAVVAVNVSGVDDEVLAAEIEADIDVQKALRLLLAGLLGTTSVSDSDVTFKRLDDDATDAATVTVGDDDGERTTTTVA